MKAFFQKREQVDRWLKERLAVRAAEAPERMPEAMAYSLLAGGKRVRPLLCVAICDAICPEPSDEAQRALEDAACALEFIHTYSLIHDDLPCMDNDDFRRGRPTSHKVFGEGLAVLAGDALLTEAFALLSEPPTALRCRLVRELALAAGVGGMVGGQALDISESRLADADYVEKLHRMKTGALIRGACRMGAVCGGASPALLESASSYGESLGLAFQIADDVLDVVGTSQTMGKPVGGDAREGRDTYARIFGVERAREMARAEMEKAVRCAEQLQSPDGLLAQLARYAVERSD